MLDTNGDPIEVGRVYSNDDRIFTYKVNADNGNGTFRVLSERICSYDTWRDWDFDGSHFAKMYPLPTDYRQMRDR